MARTNGCHETRRPGVGTDAAAGWVAMPIHRVRFQGCHESTHVVFHDGHLGPRLTLEVIVDRESGEYANDSDGHKELEQSEASRPAPQLASPRGSIAHGSSLAAILLSIPSLCGQTLFVKCSLLGASTYG